ncbi:FAD/NAD(P)-binding domain-containing protein [Mycena sanguinolenta]|uniref:FAD/NAD(P)-binding domain-containing protein n=1 Tax=Mycena sanguinolenta TaxID=230812 RepID=A0A8H6XHQ6_9AGAR|nr:FAD/NAD(P)-binding domain-containing protein [Mycena sanguinolenta]
MDEETAKIWKGGAVYCLGGRSTVWSLFSPRISDDTFRMHFPEDVYNSLTSSFLQSAERYVPFPPSDLSSPSCHHRQAQHPHLDVLSPRDAYRSPLRAVMDDPHGKGKFKTPVDSPVDRLESAPVRDQKTQVEHFIVKVSEGRTHTMKCKNVIIATGAMESPAIVLRGVQAANPTLTDVFGPSFERNFDHVTDHYIFYVTLPFYCNAANEDVLGGMKLQTDITFNQLDNTTALANISLDASAFLPRRNVPGFIAYIFPSELQTNNPIELNEKSDLRIKVGYASEPMLPEKNLLRRFSVDVMSEIAAVLELQFVKHAYTQAPYVPLETVTLQDTELGPGGITHKMGSLPMPKKSGNGGVLDSNLQMKYDWSNPIVVYNLLPKDVWVRMSTSRASEPLFGPSSDKLVKSGKSELWKCSTRETIQVYAFENSESYNVQVVEPGVNALIEAPPME